MNPCNKRKGGIPAVTITIPSQGANANDAPGAANPLTVTANFNVEEDATATAFVVGFDGGNPILCNDPQAVSPPAPPAQFVSKTFHFNNGLPAGANVYYLLTVQASTDDGDEEGDAGQATIPILLNI